MTSLKSRLTAALLGTALTLTGLSGCGDQQVTYAPAAYGEVIVGIGHCYYVQDPAEVGYLYAANLCPHTWVGTLAPLYWHERYFSYYDSPAYYNRYVPPGRRTVYVTTQRGFSVTYRSQISRQTRYASYRGSNGRTYSGGKVGTSRFGSGTGFGSSAQRYGGGTVRGGGNSGSRIGGGSVSRGYSGGGSMRSGRR